MQQQQYQQFINTIIKYNNQSLFIEKQLGDGAQGGVFKAIDRQQNLIYALKLQQELSQNEAIVLNKLIQHKDSLKYNIKIYDKFKYNSYHCILMEYAPTKNLYESIADDHEDHDVKEMLRQLTLGLQELHNLNMVHRDIKPENIVMFDEQNSKKTYKICDTGLIRLDGDPNFIDNILKGSGSAFYQAPEMLAGYTEQEQYNNKVDVFALGAVIYEVIMNQTLFDQQNEEDMANERIGSLNNTSIIMDRVDKMTKIDQPFKQLLKDMLQPDHHKRFTIKQVLESIQSLKPKLIRIIPTIKSQKNQPIIQQQLPLKIQSNQMLQQENEYLKQQLEKSQSVNEILSSQIKQLIAENEQLKEKLKVHEQPKIGPDEELKEIEQIISEFPSKLKETLKMIAQDQYIAQFSDKKNLLTTTSNGADHNTRKITTVEEYLKQLLRADWLKDQIISIDKLVLKFWEQLSEVSKLVYRLKLFQTFELLKNIETCSQSGRH